MRKHLLLFVALAVVLLAGRLAWRLIVPADTTQIVVSVPRDATPSLRARRAQDAVLIEEAIALNLHLRDPVIIGRLAINILFARGEPVDPDHLPDNARDLAEEAIALNMHRTDAVVRRRLVDVMERALLHDFERKDPGDRTIRRHLETHRNEFVRAARYRFADRFFSSESRGEAGARDAAQAALRGVSSFAPPSAAEGDAPLFINRGALTTATALNARYGDSFGEQLAECELDKWCGPIESSFGFHLVRVVEAVPEFLPDLTEIRPAVLASWRDAHRRAELERKARKITRRYDVEFIEETPQTR